MADPLEQLTRYRIIQGQTGPFLEPDDGGVGTAATQIQPRQLVYLASEVERLAARSSSAEGPTNRSAILAALSVLELQQFAVSIHPESEGAVLYTDVIKAFRDVTDASEALRALAAEWQPIETAPKVHLFKADLWVPDRGGRLTDCVYSTAFDSPQWCFKPNYGDYGIWEVVPTHWMPRPDPPAAKLDALAEQT